MKKFTAIPLWKEIPFLRLLLPFLTGIYLQHSCPLSTAFINLWILSALVIVISFSLLPLPIRFRWRLFQGLLIQALLIGAGFWITDHHNVITSDDWVGTANNSNGFLKTRLLETPVEKEKTFKVSVIPVSVARNSEWQTLSGTILCYLGKDSSLKDYSVGDNLYFQKGLTPIKSSGNPGSFDFARYQSLQQCYHQVYLPEGSFSLVKNPDKNAFSEWLENSRKSIVTILKKYIPNAKEAGLAEALLIGYKDDLDKTLVQSYANTGVVHIIAISGLHLGLIYWLLANLLSPLKKTRLLKWIRPIGIITGLWIFSLLAGASPSVLRSAVMFSSIVIGEIAGKKSSGINSLLASAFLLLCYNPLWLWDTGFQLSYAAVLSLLVFMKPVYGIWTIKNKWLDLLWKMNAVTIAAQVLTLPLCLYYFHQFPNAFLITNLVAVPLSSLILFVELALCLVSAWAFIAIPIGNILQWLLHLMNSFIEQINKMPYAVWNDLYLTEFQTALCYLFILAISSWLIQRKPRALFGVLSVTVLFMADHCRLVVQTKKQQVLIVYNIPKTKAAAVIMGDQYFFKGEIPRNEDSVNILKTLHSSQLRYRSMKTVNDNNMATAHYLQIGLTYILFLEGAQQISAKGEKIRADILVLSQDPEISPRQLLEQVDCRTIILDASNKRRTVIRWTEAAAEAGIGCYSVVDKGAFVINLP